MADKKITQNDMILKYMSDYGGITQIEAIRDLGVMRLASRISDLKRKGYNIIGESVPVKNRYGGECHVSRYRLV